jgi:hypothetical protein
MDDPNSLRKEEITRYLYDIDQSLDFRLHPRRAGLGSHCQFDVHLGSSNSNVCRLV